MPIEHIKVQYRRVKELYLRHERILIPGTLVAGFLIDYLTFTAIQINTALAILIGYWILTALTIVIMLYTARAEDSAHRFIKLLSPLLLQYLFGSLLGGAFIFYWFAGALSVSWPIILILAILMVSNEVFRHYFLDPAVQICVYFFTTFALFTIVLPFAFHSLDSRLFLAAGGVSIVFIYLFLTFTETISPRVKKHANTISSVIITILVLMNVFYFTSIIPPVPLAIREAGIYHSVTHAGSDYILTEEKESILEKLAPGETVHITAGQPIYAYTAIFAPTDLDTTIYHRWEHFNKAADTWEDAGLISFSIAGGRVQGYRGYTEKSNVPFGKWRVSVETARGQVLGRLRFTVEPARESLRMKTVRE